MPQRKFTSRKVEEIKRKKKKIFKRRVVIFLFFLFILFIGLGFLSRINNFNINNVKVSGVKVLDNIELENFIKEKISGNYFLLYKKSNILLLSRKKIKKDLMGEWHRIEALTFNLDNFNTLKIKVEERKPVYTYCGEDISYVLLRPEEYRCQFMDKKGFVFGHAPYFSGDIYFRFFGQLENFYFEKENFNNLILLKDNLSRLELSSIALYQKNEDETEIYLSSNRNLTESPKIIFNTNTDYLEIFQNLEASLKTNPLKLEFKDNYKNLLYLDLRFNNKVFYKFK